MKDQLLNDIRYFLTKGDDSLIIDEDVNLFHEGYLDSIGVLEMIEMIESKTGKEFDPDILVADNLSTLRKIEKLIENLK
jgi:acyl carrier protein